jgi:glycosyltransferase involved in cell wall biosynthesis
VRILWYSNAPHVGSGYGNQTDLFVPRLRALGHQMAIAAYWGIQGNRVEADGIPIYPASPSGGIDFDSMGMPAKHHAADIIISLMDIWALPPGITGGIPLCPWFPVDHEPLMPPVMHRLKPPSPISVLVPLVFSRIGERLVKEAGYDCRYVPHGVDTTIYTPGDKTAAREIAGLPKDAFVYGMVAANIGSPSRKAFKAQLHAFARVRQKHKDAMLYLHTRPDTSTARNLGGENLAELVQQLSITDAVVFTDPTLYHFGLESSQMATLYRSFDVLTSVSVGEGFGIPIVEAQACGTPVIVGDWTSMSELCFSGWKVPKSRAEPVHTALASYQWQPSVQGVYEQMMAAYSTGSTRMSERSKNARLSALNYDADHVSDRYWEPVLEEIDGILGNLRSRANGAPSGAFQEAINAAV